MLKIINYIGYLQEGNKPSSPFEALEYLVNFFIDIEERSAEKENNGILIGIITPEGEIDLNLLDNCEYVLHYLYPMVLGSRSEELLAKYLEISTKFLKSDNVSIASKICILDLENSSFKEQVNSAFSTVALALHALRARIEFCSYALSNLDSDIFSNEESIKNILSTYVSKSIDLFLDNGQILQVIDYLNLLLSNSKSSAENFVLVNAIISHSTSFNLSSKTELFSLIEEYEDDFSSEEFEYIKSSISSDPNGMLIFNFEYTSGNLSYKTTRGKRIVTLIQFSIPQSYIGNCLQKINVNDYTCITLIPVSAFWADPMFKIFRNWKIANMGWSHFCDVEAEKGMNYTHIVIELNELFIPDVVLTEDSNNSIDFSDKEALMGRKYYPHKEYIVKTFLENFASLSKFIKIEKKDVNINLFSNYFIQYIDLAASERIASKLFSITNPDSYSKILTRFIDRMNSINLADSFVNVRELLMSTKIESEKNLKEFVYRCIDLFVKHTIENHGGYKYLWKNNDNGVLVPCRESESQPYIFSHLRSVFDFMGIQISREVESSNGEIDFLVTYTNSGNKLLRVCVELKLAHAAKVEEGLTNQLPAYLDGERCKYGIYIVLWYKGNSFSKPSKYSSIVCLEERLHSINANSNISSMIIDCAKPISPSKLK